MWLRLWMQKCKIFGLTCSTMVVPPILQLKLGSVRGQRSDFEKSVPHEKTVSPSPSQIGVTPNISLQHRWQLSLSSRRRSYAMSDTQRTLVTSASPLATSGKFLLKSSVKKARNSLETTSLPFSLLSFVFTATTGDGPPPIDTVLLLCRV
jgi:hypothetical protein